MGQLLLDGFTQSIDLLQLFVLTEVVGCQTLLVKLVNDSFYFVDIACLLAVVSDEDRDLCIFLLAYTAVMKGFA